MHIKECPLEEVVCEYHTVGCEATFPRKDQVKHKKKMMENHLMMAAHKLSKLGDIQQELIDAKVERTSLSNSLSTTTNALAQTKHELTDTKLNLRNAKDEIVTLKRSLDDTRGMLCTTTHELRDTKSELKYTKDEVAKLERSLSDTKCQLAVTSTQITNLMVLLHTQIKPIMGINVSEVVSDAKPIVKLNAMAAVFKLGDQITPVILKMAEYKMKQKENKQWFSEPFFTHIQGYKMRLSAVAAGVEDGKGSHLSLYLYLMKGPHDDTLKWPLRETFEVKLMNQIGKADHHSIIITFEAPNHDHSRGKGHSKFISNKDLCVTTATRQFLKDNCVFFSVTKL